MALPAGATRKNVNSRRIVNTFHGKPPLAGLAHDDDDDDDIILNFFIVANARVDVGVVIVIVPRDVSQHRPGAALAAGSHRPRRSIRRSSELQLVLLLSSSLMPPPPPRKSTASLGECVKH